MKATFLTKDFLLHTDAARELYHVYAENLPIIDYHNHLDPKALATDQCYGDLAELWVAHDPYKHRAMRIDGVPENRITGKVSSKEKYEAWARTCPDVIGNPLYHWTALELKRIFHVDDLLAPDTAERIYQHCNSLLQQKEYSTVGILRKWNTEIVCTSDDLLDDVSLHRTASECATYLKVLPSLRADSMLAFGTPNFKSWMERLEQVAPINSLEDYLYALHLRLDAFEEAGCRLSDHALDSGFAFLLPDVDEASRIFAVYLQSGHMTAADKVKLSSFVLLKLAQEYAARGWVMQLHIGAERFTTSRLRRLCGPAGGYATIGNVCDIRSLCDFLDSAESAEGMPKTILYTLNPADNAAFATLTGSFTGDGVVGKLQFGPAWWYNDHKEGIENHFRALSSYGLLSRFIGMTTDSRSILSFSRHEYFRRILCGYIGEQVEKGELPNEMELLGEMVKNISYNNVYNWCFSRKSN
ncbi:glucuronate isomerase [Bacteroides timonensis]|uniref:glucuronate isomerase n=1 Tax=Bacteroides timonensis TaxID=1470345 RepID=UPI0004AFA8D8|nr:glucuronate isomerase [Bacteroides timonensis]